MGNNPTLQNFIETFTADTEESYSFLQILGMSHWQSFIMFLFVLITFIILIYKIVKKKKHIARATIGLILIGSLIYLILTSPLVNEDAWKTEAQDWLMLTTNIFIELILVVVPLFIFFTIIKTLNSNRHKQIKGSNLLKSFFAIWLMPFIAITVAVLMYPLIAQINMPPSPGKIGIVPGSEISTVPGIIGSAVPGSISIFISIEFILSVVVFSIFMGFMINFIHRHEHQKGESLIKFSVNAQVIINKYIKMVSLLIPIVLATRIPLLFDYVTLTETFIGLLTFVGVFLLGWLIVIFIELCLTYATMRNRSTKNFFKYIGYYFGEAFVKHAAPVLLDETIKESESLGVSKDVAELTSSMSTSMGQSTCGGFYPAMIALMTISMVYGGMDVFSADGGVGVGNIIAFLFVLYLIIMITNLGMTGVPGADTAVVISVLGALGLGLEYFATVFVIDGIINRVRGIANAFGFVAANNIAERAIKTKKHENESLIDDSIVLEGEVVNDDI